MNQKTEITQHYFKDLLGAMGDTDTLSLPDGTSVRVYRGRAANVVINQPNRSIDLSEGPNGEMFEGIETKSVDAPHDDEREVVEIRRIFPENEEDIRFLSDIASSIRNISEGY